MNRKTVIWIALAFILIAAGSLIFTGVMVMNKWNFKKLSTVKYETNTYELGAELDNVIIDVKTADVIIKPSEDGSSRAVIRESVKEKHTLTLENKSLTVKSSDTRKWYEYITLFDFESPSITLYLEKSSHLSLSVSVSTGELTVSDGLCFDRAEVNGTTGDLCFYADVKHALTARLSTGDIKINGIATGALDLFVTTGDVRLSGVICTGNAGIRLSTGDLTVDTSHLGSLSTKASTGNLKLIDTLVEQSIHAERSTGNVRLDKCDADEILIVTNTGDIKGTLLSEKIFRAKSNTGFVSVPDTLVGGLCDIKTDTGDIKITLLEK